MEATGPSGDRTGRFLGLVLSNPWNAAILDRMGRLGVADWWLTSGCLVQTVWNGLYGHPPDHGILDYDVFYFDPDTGWDAEDAVIRRAARLFADLPVRVQIRNQARVPLWYEEKFGVRYPPVRTASDGIDRFPCATTSVGLRREGEGFRIHAPYGLDLLLQGVLLPNTTLWVPGVYAAKAARWRAVWPELVLVPWPEGAGGAGRPAGRPYR
jgi:uncharacterized protein